MGCDDSQQAGQGLDAESIQGCISEFKILKYSSLPNRCRCQVSLLHKLLLRAKKIFVVSRNPTNLSFYPSTI